MDPLNSTHEVDFIWFFFKFCVFFNLWNSEKWVEKWQIEICVWYSTSKKGVVMTTTATSETKDEQKNVKTKNATQKKHSQQTIFKLSFESIGKLFIRNQFVICQYIVNIAHRQWNSAEVKDSHNHWSIMDKENGSGGGSSKHKNSNSRNAQQPTIDVNDPSSLLNAASLFGESFSAPALLLAVQNLNVMNVAKKHHRVLFKGYWPSAGQPAMCRICDLIVFFSVFAFISLLGWSWPIGSSRRCKSIIWNTIWSWHGYAAHGSLKCKW